jgi:hypothetical protein
VFLISSLGFSPPVFLVMAAALSNADKLRKASHARWDNLRIDKYKEDEFDVFRDSVRYNLSVRDASWMLRERIAGDDELQERMLLALLTSIPRDRRNELKEYDSFTSAWKKLQARHDATELALREEHIAEMAHATLELQETVPVYLKRISALFQLVNQGTDTSSRPMSETQAISHGRREEVSVPWFTS